MANQGSQQEPTMEEILASIRRIISEEDDQQEGPSSSAQPAEQQHEEFDETLTAGDDFDLDSHFPVQEDQTPALRDEEPMEPQSFAEHAETHEGQQPLDHPHQDIREFGRSAYSDDEGSRGSVQNLHGMQEAPQLTDSQPELESEQTGESIEGYEVTADPTPDVVPMRANEPEPPLGQASSSVETSNLINTEEGAMADQDQDSESLVSSEAAGAAAAAFGSLSRSLNAPSSESGQTIDDLVRQLLRPMLKAWLDENLPRIVERAVQEEVERVARRGR